MPILSAHLAKLPSAKYAHLVDHAVVLFKTTEGWTRVHQIKSHDGGPTRLEKKDISESEALAHTFGPQAADPHAVAARAKDVLNRQGQAGTGLYSVFGNNCEHWATYIFDGQPRSAQLNLAVAGAAILGGVLLGAALAGSGDRSDENAQA